VLSVRVQNVCVCDARPLATSSEPFRELFLNEIIHAQCAMSDLHRQN